MSFVGSSAFSSGRASCDGERVEDALVDPEVEHHLQAVAELAEVVVVVLRRDVRFREDDRVACAPLQELAHVAQHVVLLDVLLVGALGLDHERDRIHPKAGHAELEPEAHDLANLFLDLWVLRVEVGLKVVEAMEVVLAGDVDLSSTSSSARRGTPCPRRRPSASSRTTGSSRDTSSSCRAALLGTTGADRSCG